MKTGTTSFKDTLFGILPRQKVLKLEIEGNKRGLEFISTLGEQAIAWFQHGFVQIHPFNDYNGRTARMLTSFLLLKFNLHPFEIKANTTKDRKNYIKAMQMADEGNYLPLEKLIEEALTESLSS